MVYSFPSWFAVTASALFGSILGSFFNVCIYRIPKNVSVVTPPSACPYCRHRILPYDNIPILGWLFLRGKCRQCKHPISWRYPLVELLTASLFAGLAWKFGMNWMLPAALYFAGTMILVLFIDLDSMIIPDSITLPGTVAGLVASAVLPISFLDSLMGAAGGFGFLFLVAWSYHRITGREGLGGGDIKLAALLGAFLGWQGVLMTVLAASGLGTLVAVGLVAAHRGGRRTALPFGVFLAPAALGVFLWGHEAWAWYSQFLR